MKSSLSILLVLFLLFAVSCNQDDITLPKTITLDEKSTELIEAENEFGLELFQKIYAGEEAADNIMVSPLSVSLALAMTYNGANGETQKAMEETLKVYGLSPDEINESYASLVAALKSLDPKVILEIANAIYYREGFPVEQDFVSTNQNYYDAEVEALNFSSPQAVNIINDWVADKTHDKIDKILDNISGDHVMFLLNAIYFKGIWQSEFDEDYTEDLPFYLENGSTAQVPTMQKTESLPYYSNNVFRAVKLAYGAGNYNMFVFLPQEENSLEDIVDELSVDTWKSWMESFTDTVNIDLKLPRLKYKYEITLNEVLADMGMGVAFGDGADFTGINKGGGLKIDYVKHKTFIEVNEKGTEAAAVTVVAIGYTSVGPQNMQFNVNRPFLYAITEKDTDAILFMGTVKNPESEE
ncbi:serpin B [Draconibacterium orientale]|uniref:Proteinase inhibitor I4 serpin n=1 Tax=Draconibacterium orientale TaxID=1168034 RepID=X5DY52_9BACT|nr:serpin family protein [Draconibacterium orientale]AHW60170.1 proteinase inhibitor I4 serpin [Draconibacterium orientale]SES97800.1 serpin B [Draconibacterium orientale]